MILEPFICSHEPKDSASVWQVPEGKKVCVHLRHVVLTVVLLVPMTLTATLGTISFSAADGTAITSFWPAAAFQIVFSIWFGFWGVLAGVMGPMLGNCLMGDSAFLFIPANIVQCCLVGWWFRRFKLDPRLTSRRDWVGLLLVGCVAANVLGAVLGLTESYIRNPALGGEAGWLGFWLGKLGTWLEGNILPSLILAPALLKSLSPMMVRGPLFCQCFWGCVDYTPKHRLGFRDFPMQAKLMLLVLTVGILPLSAVAGLTVWDMVKTADKTASDTTLDLVQDIRLEIERHELLLQMWSAKLDDPRLSDADRETLVSQWDKLPQTFTKLAIVDREEIESEVSPEIMEAFGELGIMFYDAEREEIPFSDDFLKGAIELSYAPDKVLTGMVSWYGGMPQDSLAELMAVGGMFVFDQEGNGRYKRVPPELEGWQAPAQKPNGSANYTIEYGGQKWHVADVEVPRLGWRFVRLTSVKVGQAAALASISNPVAVMINLAIFGSLIMGGLIAGQISNRALLIAEQVSRSGAQPGQLHISIKGRDELGYLGETLNRMSRELAENVKRLQETTAEKERLEAEMKLARQVQRSILPHQLPQVSGYEFAAVNHPAREVGGDFYDFIGAQKDRMVITIGDVVGKGLKAAMFATEAHGLVHAAALNRATTPARILSEINSTFVSSRMDSSNFVTMFCGMLEANEHRLFYASAGHNPPILLRNGQVRNLNLGGLPLAVEEQGGYQLYEEELVPGDAVIMYTDGVTDAMNIKRDTFGTDRLYALAQEHPDRSAAEMLDVIVNSITTFVADAPQYDDITLLIFRRCIK